MNEPSREQLTRAALAASIDHSVLGPMTTTSDVRRVCEQALAERFAAVCVNSSHVMLGVEVLAESGIPLAATIGFPLGACSHETKIFEAHHALDCGALELDMVLALGLLRAGQTRRVSAEVSAIAELCTPFGARLKVILETCYLNPNELSTAIDLACDNGAHFVKTSTGFGSAGATAKDVALLRRQAPQEVGVKAAGGIRSLQDATAMLNAGASRLGCSASMEILDELPTMQR